MRFESERYNWSSVLFKGTNINMYYEPEMRVFSPIISDV